MGPTIALLCWLSWQVDFNAQGSKALDEKRYQAAVEAFAEAVKADPGDFSAHFNLALASSLLGNDAASIEEYKKTLALKPGLYQAELNLGIVLLRQKQAGVAVPHLDAARGQKPNEYRPNFFLAEALLESGEFASASERYATALAANPKSAAAELGLGRALARLHRLPDAAQHFRKAAEMDTSLRTALLELAALYDDAKQPEEALALYRQFPENAGARERTGELLLDAGKPGEAVEFLPPGVARAKAYLENKQPDRALAILAEALNKTPNDYDLRMMMGRVLRDQRKLNEAAGQFFAATKVRPDSDIAWSELASALVVAGQYPEAIGALDRVRALHAEKPGHLYYRALALDHLRALKPALEGYRQFLAVSKDLPDEEFIARQRARILERELSKR